MSQTYFDLVGKASHCYVTISPEGKINTLEFLEATNGVVRLFDLLNNSAFAVVKSDMSGNINKIRASYDKDPASRATLQDLVDSEIAQKQDKSTNSGTDALLWLKRGLEFISLAMQHTHDNPTEELSKSFGYAYERTLSKHHSFLIRPVLNLAMGACPYRKDFFLKLGEDQQKVQTQFSEWLPHLSKQVDIIVKFYQTKGYDKA